STSAVVDLHLRLRPSISRSISIAATPYLFQLHLHKSCLDLWLQDLLFLPWRSSHYQPCRRWLPTLPPVATQPPTAAVPFLLPLLPLLLAALVVLSNDSCHRWLSTSPFVAKQSPAIAISATTDTGPRQHHGACCYPLPSPLLLLNRVCTPSASSSLPTTALPPAPTASFPSLPPLLFPGQ
ncbi:hypothetical protein BHE74_00025532, partial [Ensete ventricosum]